MTDETNAAVTTGAKVIRGRFPRRRLRAERLAPLPPTAAVEPAEVVVLDAWVAERTRRRPERSTSDQPDTA